MIKSAAMHHNGTIYTGSNHSDIVTKHPESLGWKEGFVDDVGNFLDRFDAAKHAYECGQTKEHKGCLFSYHI